MKDKGQSRESESVPPSNINEFSANKENSYMNILASHRLIKNNSEEKENILQTPNKNLVNNTERIEIFREKPVSKVASQISISIPKDWESSFSELIVEEVEIEDSGFDDLDKNHDAKDFEEYKSEDFTNSLHLGEEDSFALESQLSIGEEDMPRNF